MISILESETAQGFARHLLLLCKFSHFKATHLSTKSSKIVPNHPDYNLHVGKRFQIAKIIFCIPISEKMALSHFDLVTLYEPQ